MSERISDAIKILTCLKTSLTTHSYKDANKIFRELTKNYLHVINLV